MSDYSAIQYSVSGSGVATLAFNRPDSFNGINMTMMHELDDALSGLHRRGDARVFVLTGVGRAFCPGADVKAADTSETGSLGVPDPAVHDERVPVMLKELPIPTIAAINGACAGAGFGLACACDLRVAAASAVFRSAFLTVAVAGDFGVPWTLPRLVGDATAKEIMFLDEKFDAAKALSIGLVSRVWADDEFRSHVQQMANALAEKAPAAIASMKRHFLFAERVDYRSFIELEFQRHFHLLATADAREGFSAFVEKRPPRFTGH